jgi:DNA-binding beta-propeller fold protein YncE
MHCFLSVCRVSPPPAESLTMRPLIETLHARCLRRIVVLALGLGGAWLAVGRLGAQEKSRPERVYYNLLNPCGLAIQPGTDYVFISTRFGIYRYDPNYKRPEEHKAGIEIDDYPKQVDVFGPGPKYEIGPLGLAFLDRDHLVVGDGSRKKGEELVRIYKLPATPPPADGWIKEDSAEHTLGPIKAGTDSSTGEGDFFGVAVGHDAIWVTCHGDETKGWIAKSELKDGKPGPLKPTIATKTATQVAAPGPITFTPDGKELVVGLMGDLNSEERDSVIAFFDPADGSLKRKMNAGLYDVTGLAYSPKTKKLYATDFAWKKPRDGGLFELTVDGDKMKATRIVALEKPAALAFAPAGHLYVTVFDAQLEGAEKARATDPGALLYIKPGL